MNAFASCHLHAIEIRSCLDRDSARLGNAPAIAQSQGQAMAIPAYFSLDNNPNIPQNPHGTTLDQPPDRRRSPRSWFWT